MKFLFLLLLTSCTSYAFTPFPLSEFPPVLTNNTVRIGYYGWTNSPLRLEATANLLGRWTVIAITNKTGSPSGTLGWTGTFVVSNSVLSGFVSYTTNITPEFHGYAYVTHQDFSVTYEWVDQAAVTNITSQQQVFFRLHQGPIPLLPLPTVLSVIQVICFTCGLITAPTIYKCLFQ